LADSPEENWQAGLAFQTAARQIPQIRRRKRRPGAGVQRGSSRGEYKKRAKLADHSEETDGAFSAQASKAGGKRGSCKPRAKPADRSEETDGALTAVSKAGGKRGSYKPRAKPADQSDKADGVLSTSRRANGRVTSTRTQ
jgi:hypothetical protein